MRLVVSDTSPLTALLQIDRAELLPILFEDIIIPEAVHRELLRTYADLPSWLRITKSPPIPDTIASSDLDRGEAEAISLAVWLQADLLLIDELKGREVARAHGLEMAGVLGVLVLAKRRGLIPAVLPLIDELRQTATCWFSDDLVQHILRLAGE